MLMVGVWVETHSCRTRCNLRRTLKENMPSLACTPSTVTRLNFVLPPFSRLAWVHDRAREMWETRFPRIASCWREIEWQTIVDGVRACALLWASHEELVNLAPVLKQHGLRATPLTSTLRALAEEGQNVLVYRVAIGKRRELSGFRRAWIRGDDDVIGQYLGYPACCRSFFHQVVVEHGWLDPTWPRAVSAMQREELVESIDLQVFPELNLFWESLALRLVPHIPCSYACNGARELAIRFLATGRRCGYGAELDHLLEVTRWPVEWSALHGIAEIKTPIVKLSTRTDATPRKLVLRHHGDRYPKEGARGVRFPYSMPAGVAANQ